MPFAPGRSSASHSPALTPPPASAFEPVPPTLDAALATGMVGSYDVLRYARLSLLHALPSTGLAWSLWCGHCGALREVGEDPEAVARANRKRDADGFLKAEAEDELEAELNAHFAVLERLEEEEKARPARPPQRRRRPPHCSACGTKFQRPRPTPPPYPSARAARTRRQSALAADAQAQAKEAAKSVSPAGTVDAAQLLGCPSQKPAPGIKNVAAGGPIATYPQPMSVPPPQPNGGITTTLPTSPPPAKKRKTKKSGLKQLLAQNAARKVENGSSNWGLG
ncbi:hypothetical protein CspeluHIS016_0304090 [Cutaneotrichosporon spelunceum]|uniref:Uncharacterized protein n=1 Tax=Cutaneotrichosporon spelunceum TaxID=1672016 RepID=A0AAD3TU37_9TREE|nr:hypothetical protein CspeluHIS016_0304090 [Cutaneotrichosporon spelunceum]